ncbi:hypothetical protein [Streptomyces sp. NBRC 109706]|uniref:hypothetical protein n=1 Tax=Streptomyces sp. NBRC 109706 TaxID=1550035 RepID=UPI00131B6CCF|nr:hypothetical protein [Streptomyces sp. NBRC 109706]
MTNRSAEELTVLVPDQPPVLNPVAARALLRLLRIAHQRRTRRPGEHGLGDENTGAHQSERRAA